MKTLVIKLLLVFLPLALCAQQPTKQQMEQKQKEALEQLKKMGINIDPNKPMSKADAEKLKNDMLKQAGGITAEMKKKTGIMDSTPAYHSKIIDISKTITAKMVKDIAERFFKRSYATLNAIEKVKFDNEYKKAQKDSFSQESVRRLADLGVEYLLGGNNHFQAALFLTAAVKANPTDTAAINNFGGYLRVIDSIKTSLPVLLYARSLDSISPVIATQLAATLFELGDDKKSEALLKETLEIHPDHWGAHEGLCLIYFTRGEIDKAMVEVFRSASAGGGGTSAKLYGNIKAQQQANAQKTGGKAGTNTNNDALRNALKPAVYEVKDFDSKVKFPAFPVIQRLEDWTGGGAYANSVKVYDLFHKELMAFVERRKAIAMQPQPIRQGAYTRAYLPERLMIQGIIDFFKEEARKNDKAYQQEIDKIMKGMDNAVTAYTDQAEAANKVMQSCMEQCGEQDAICKMKCYQAYCRVTCPAAEVCNNKLAELFNAYTKAFVDYKGKQEKLLDDFYAFSQPWADKIESGYWSRLVEFDRKAFALGVVGAGYINYNVPFASKVTGCPDCSIIYMVFEERPAPTKAKDPSSNSCELNGKIGITLLICEVELDCESIEFGCSAGVSAAVKRNFKRNNTTFFLGAGVEGKSDFFKAGGKIGGTLTIDDQNNVVDFGYKSEVTLEARIAPKTTVGGSMESSYSFQEGFKVEGKGKLGIEGIED